MGRQNTDISAKYFISPSPSLISKIVITIIIIIIIIITITIIINKINT